MSKMNSSKRMENITIFFGGKEGPVLYANTIVVNAASKKIILDPSADSEEVKRLSAERPFVVNSHYHGDHRRLNYLFDKSEFFAPEPDAPMLSDNKKFIDAIGVDDKEIGFQWINAIKDMYNITEHHITGTFKDGDYVIDKSYGIYAIGLPGHTLGHSGFIFKDADIAIITDIDLTSFGPWYGNETSDIDAFLESIEKVKHLDVKYVLTSHVNAIYTKEELIPLLDKFAAHIKSREDKLMNCLHKHPMTLEDLSKKGIIYPKKWLDNNNFLIFFEKKMLEKHIIRLKAKLLIKEQGAVLSIL